MGIALMFLLAPMSLPMRVVGAGILVAATLFVFRMTKPGLVLTREAISIVSVIRTQRFPWEQVGGFIGERRHDEARVLMVLGDERRSRSPGRSIPRARSVRRRAMLSAADQLNHLREVAISGELPAPVSVVQAPVPRTRSGDSGGSSKDRRRERKELRAALKAVRLPKTGRPAIAPTPDDEPAPAAPAPAEPHQPAPAPGSRDRRAGAGRHRPRREKPAAEGLPSYFPTPTYIPQAEYAQMLRDQKAAEKAAAEASAELARLAGLDELAKKEEFSDWTS